LSYTLILILHEPDNHENHNLPRDNCVFNHFNNLLSFRLKLKTITTRLVKLSQSCVQLAKTPLQMFPTQSNGSWIVCCLHVEKEFRSCAMGVRGVASFITTDKQLQLNRCCYFPMQAVISEVLSTFSVKFNLLQLLFRSCVSAVKCRPVLHYCVDIISGPQGS